MRDITKQGGRDGDDDLTASRSVHRPGGIVLASCTTASVIRRQTAFRVVIACGRELVGPRDAFGLSVLAVALEHQVRVPPDLDLRYRAAKPGRPRSIRV